MMVFSLVWPYAAEHGSGSETDYDATDLNDASASTSDVYFGAETGQIIDSMTSRS